MQQLEQAKKNSLHFEEADALQESESLQGVVSQRKHRAIEILKEVDA